MVPWVPFLSYGLLLVLAALLGWLPFRIIEHYSLVGEVQETRSKMARHAHSSGVTCVDCGTHNATTYSYCGQCGHQLPPSE